MAERDYYEVLGISREASQGDIKKAYRKLALKHHPDKQSTEEGRRQASEIFAKISNAYEILSDPQQRREYDNRGRFQNNFQNTGGRSASAPEPIKTDSTCITCCITCTTMWGPSGLISFQTP